MLVFECFLANLTLVWSFSCGETQEDTGLRWQGWPPRLARPWGAPGTPLPSRPAQSASYRKLTRRNKQQSPPFMLQLRPRMLLIVVILLKQLRIIKKMTQSTSMENWQLQRAADTHENVRKISLFINNSADSIMYAPCFFPRRRGDWRAEKTFVSPGFRWARRG